MAYVYWSDSAFHVVSVMRFTSTWCACCVLCCLLQCCLALQIQCIVQNPLHLLAFHFSTPTQTQKIDTALQAKDAIGGAHVISLTWSGQVWWFAEPWKVCQLLHAHCLLRKFCPFTCVFARVSLSLLCPSLSMHPVLYRSYRKNTMATLLQLKLIRWQVLHVHLFVAADHVFRRHFTLDISAISKAFCHYSSALLSGFGRFHCDIICKKLVYPTLVD